MQSKSSLSSLYSLPLVIVMAVAGFLLIDLLPSLHITKEAPYLLIAVAEGFLVLQIMAAWRSQFERLPFTHLYILLAVLFIRLVYRLLGDSNLIWAFRSASVHSVDLGLIGFAGMAALHPAVYQRVQRTAQSIALWPLLFRVILFGGFLAVFVLACSQFRSYHITRDGFDWIERTTQPVWYLYMREPLTIGLYRWVFLLLWRQFEATSFQTIGFLSIAGGVWWAVWMGAFAGKKWADGFDRLLAWLLMASSGGLIVLFFAHIEVYPLFVAGLMPALYFAHQYQQEKNGIVWAAVFFSIAFLLHLSAAWLLPAFVLLPLFRSGNRSWIRDCALFCGIFGLIQACFWGMLIVVYYDSSLMRFWARMNETFFVGLDRAMFLPQWMWFHPRHLFDLANVYIYYSLPCVLLIPVCLFRLPSRLSRELGFWLTATAGYFLYTFFWNPDRGYPEDWDLFSPFTLLTALLFVQLLLPQSTEKAEKSDFSEYQRSLLYLAAIGTFAFACSQIYFHHIVPFVPPQYR